MGTLSDWRGGTVPSGRDTRLSFGSPEPAGSVRAESGNLPELQQLELYGKDRFFHLWGQSDGDEPNWRKDQS